MEEKLIISCSIFPMAELLSEPRILPFSMEDTLPSCDHTNCLAEDGNSRMFHWLHLIKFTIIQLLQELCTPLFIPTWKEQAQLKRMGGLLRCQQMFFLMDHFHLTADEVCCFGDNLVEMLMPVPAIPSLMPYRGHRYSKRHLTGILQILKSFL